jgi:hypothetical protein
MAYHCEVAEAIPSPVQRAESVGRQHESGDAPGSGIRRWQPRIDVEMMRSDLAIGHSGIRAGRHGRHHTLRRSAVDGSLITCIGTKTVRGSGLRAPRRTRFRQFHNRPRLISNWRAISAIPEPACSVSHNPELILHAPTPPPFNTGDYLHQAGCL